MPRGSEPFFITWPRNTYSSMDILALRGQRAFCESFNEPNEAYQKYSEYIAIARRKKCEAKDFETAAFSEEERV